MDTANWHSFTNNFGAKDEIVRLKGRSSLSSEHLDTLVSAMPLSFKGRLVQYAGRLHRSHEAKRDAVIFDYLDENHPITQAMFRRRMAGYGEMGYRIEMPGTVTPMGFWG